MVGDIEGTQQSGIAFDLKIANLARDEQLLQYVREVAREIVDADALCENPAYRILWERLREIKGVTIAIGVPFRSSPFFYSRILMKLNHLIFLYL